MNFEERFELGALLRDDGIQTFAVKDRTSGQDLLGHFFANKSEAAELSASLDRLPERERQRIVARGDRGGTEFVVTGSLTGYAGVREWLAEQGRGSRPLDAAGAWKVILPERNVDEQFLSLFPTNDRVQAQPPEPRPATGSASAAPMGEFTRMFQAQKAPPPAPVPSAPPAAQPHSDQPGEFTRMFQTPASPTAQQPPAASPSGPSSGAPYPPPQNKPAGPGEFTRFFEAQVHESKAPQQAFATPLPSAGTPKQGEFTKVFGKGEIRPQQPSPIDTPPPVPPAAAPPAPPPPARLFEPVLPPPKPGGAPQGAGDYTRQFSAAPALTLGQANQGRTAAETPSFAPASFPAAATSGPASASRWPLWLGIAAIVILLAVVILFFVSRAK